MYISTRLSQQSAVGMRTRTLVAFLHSILKVNVFCTQLAGPSVQTLYGEELLLCSVLLLSSTGSILQYCVIDGLDHMHLLHVAIFRCCLFGMGLSSL